MFSNDGPLNAIQSLEFKPAVGVAKGHRSFACDGAARRRDGLTHDAAASQGLPVKGDNAGHGRSGSAAIATARHQKKRDEKKRDATALIGGMND